LTHETRDRSACRTVDDVAGNGPGTCFWPRHRTMPFLKKRGFKQRVEQSVTWRAGGQYVPLPTRGRLVGSAAHRREVGNFVRSVEPRSEPPPAPAGASGSYVSSAAPRNCCLRLRSAAPRIRRYARSAAPQWSPAPPAEACGARSCANSGEPPAPAPAGLWNLGTSVGISAASRRWALPAGPCLACAERGRPPRISPLTRSTNQAQGGVAHWKSESDR
jgi:hypothetical protein